MINIVARFISVVFHPLFVYWYIVVAMVLLNPYLFGYSSILEAQDLLLRVFLSVVPIPIIGVLMLKALGWAQSIELRKKEERIGPYLITAVIYLSVYVPIAKSNVALPLQVAALASVIAIFVAFFINNFIKISVHAIAMGVLTSMMIVMVAYFTEAATVLPGRGEDGRVVSSVSFVYLAILLSGLVCTSRLVTKSHSIQEIYLGYIVGFFTPLIAILIEQ